MANIETLTDENGNKVLNVQPEGDSKITLATADTYVDKNIIINIDGNEIIQMSAEENLPSEVIENIINGKQVHFTFTHPEVGFSTRTNTYIMPNSEYLGLNSIQDIVIIFSSVVYYNGFYVVAECLGQDTAWSFLPLNPIPNFSQESQIGDIFTRRIVIPDSTEENLGWVDKSYITPEEFGAVGDGETHDTIALTTCFNQRKPVRMTGTYLTTSPLNIYSDVDMVPGSIIKAGAEMDTFIKIAPAEQIRDGFYRINADGNNLCTTTIETGAVKNAIVDLYAKNTKDIGIKIGREQSNENIFRKLSVYGGTNADIGVYDLSYDSQFEAIATCDVKRGVYLDTTDFICDQVHSWIKPENVSRLFDESIVVDANGKNEEDGSISPVNVIINHLYQDTIKTGLRITRGNAVINYHQENNSLCTDEQKAATVNVAQTSRNKVSVKIKNFNSAKSSHAVPVFSNMFRTSNYGYTGEFSPRTDKTLATQYIPFSNMDDAPPEGSFYIPWNFAEIPYGSNSILKCYTIDTYAVQELTVISQGWVYRRLRELNANELTWSEWKKFGDSEPNPLLDNVITPETFGAIGNGTNDDTVAFKTAIETAQNQNKKLVAKNQYLLTDTITLGDIDAEINQIQYTGSDVAVKVWGKHKHVTIDRVNSNGSGIEIITTSTSSSVYNFYTFCKIFANNGNGLMVGNDTLTKSIYYNDIVTHYIEASNIGINILATANNFVNENKFWCNNIQGHIWGIKTVGVDNQYDQRCGNIFYNCSCEGSGQKDDNNNFVENTGYMYFENISSNIFFNPRLGEMPIGGIVIKGYSKNTTFYGTTIGVHKIKLLDPKPLNKTTFYGRIFNEAEQIIESNGFSFNGISTVPKLFNPLEKYLNITRETFIYGDNTIQSFDGINYFTYTYFTSFRLSGSLHLDENLYNSKYINHFSCKLVSDKDKKIYIGTKEYDFSDSKYNSCIAVFDAFEYPTDTTVWSYTIYNSDGTLLFSNNNENNDSINIATIDEVQQFLSLEIPDLTQEEF